MACPRCPLERIVRLWLGTDISASADRETCSVYQRVFRSTREAKKEAETRLEADGLPTLAKRRHQQLASCHTNWERAGLRTKSGRSSLPANEAQNHRPARNTANYQP